MLLSSAVHAAVLLPLALMGWRTPGPEVEDAKVMEVTLAWAAPQVAPQLSSPDPIAAPPVATRAPMARPAAVRRAPQAQPVVSPPSDGAAVAAETGPPESAAAVEAVSGPAPLQAAPVAPPPAGEVMAGYARQVLEQLDRHKRYPALSRRRGEEGTITLRLTLAADGRLVAVAAALDDAPARLVEASLAAVREAAPFPPLPGGLQVAEAVFTLPVSYRLR